MRLLSALFGVKETITVLKLSVTVYNFKPRYQYIKSDDLDCDVDIHVECDRGNRNYTLRHQHFQPYHMREIVSDYLTSIEGIRLIDHQFLYRKFDAIPKYPIDFEYTIPHGNFKQVEVEVKFIPDGRFVL